MTRDELYALVWSEPLVKIAKRFGISDVGLRKICVKHQIPTPPVGYWAKLAHGKKVVHTPLPKVSGNFSTSIFLTLKPNLADNPEQESFEEAIRERERALGGKISVPAQSDQLPHRITATTEKALLKSKPDNEGFLSVSGAQILQAHIGPNTIARGLRIIDALVKAIEERGHHFTYGDEGLQVVVDEEPLTIRMYETKSKKPHTPTDKELKAQAEHDERRKRWPSLYSSTSKTYRTWDYFPSGRLAIEIEDVVRHGWYQPGLKDRWFDDKSVPLEAALNSITLALLRTSAYIKLKRAIEADKAKRIAEAKALRLHEETVRKLENARREYLFSKATEHDQMQKLIALRDTLTQNIPPQPVNLFSNIISELSNTISFLKGKFSSEGIVAEVRELNLYPEAE